MDARRPKGPYVLWTDHGEGWGFNDFETLKEALESDHGYSTNYVITRLVDYDVIDKVAGQS